MKALNWVLLFSFIASVAYADVKISQLPLKAANTTGTSDSFPFVNATLNETDRVLLSDLIHLPSMAAQFTLMIPTQTGNATKFLRSDGTITGWSVIDSLQGTPVAGTVPTNGQLLRYNSTSLQWEPSTPAAAGITALTGDVSASGSGSVAAIVAKIRGTSVSATAPNNGEVLKYNSGSTQWEPTPGGSGAPKLVGGGIIESEMISGGPAEVAFTNLGDGITGGVTLVPASTHVLCNTYVPSQTEALQSISIRIRRLVAGSGLLSTLFIYPDSGGNPNLSSTVASANFNYDPAVFGTLVIPITPTLTNGVTYHICVNSGFLTASVELQTYGNANGQLTLNGGGTWSPHDQYGTSILRDGTTDHIDWAAPMYLEVPGLEYSDNTIATGFVELNDDLDVAWVTPNLTPGGPVLTVNTGQLDTIPPGAAIIARRLGSDSVIGTSSTRYTSGSAGYIYGPVFPLIPESISFPKDLGSSTKKIDTAYITSLAEYGVANTLAYFDAAGTLASQVKLSYFPTISSLTSFNGTLDENTNNNFGNFVWVGVGGGGNPKIEFTGKGNAGLGYLHGANAKIMSGGNGNIVGGWVGTGALHDVPTGGGNLNWGWTDDGATTGGLKISGAKGSINYGYSDGVQLIEAKQYADGAVNGGHTFLGAVTLGDGATPGFGQGSWQWGTDLITWGQLAQTLGQGHRNNTYLAAVFGRFSLLPATGNELIWDGNDPLFVVGNGVDDSTRTNAMLVQKDGQAFFSDNIRSTGVAKSIGGTGEAFGALYVNQIRGPSGSIVMRPNLRTLETAGGAFFDWSVNGTLLIKNDTHIEHLGDTPTITADCGTGATIVGNDTVGRITVGTGGVDSDCEITFANPTPWTNDPICTVTNETDTVVLRPVPTVATLTIFQLTPLTAGANISYHCEGYQ